MKKIIKSFLLFFILVNLALSIHSVTNASSPFPKPADVIKQVGNTEETNLPSFEVGQHPDAPPDYAQPGVGQVTSPIYFAIDLFRYAISGIAMLIIIISALKLVSVSSDEDAGKVKNNLVFAIVGFLVIQLANVIVKEMFFGETGDALEDAASAEIYAEQSLELIRGIVGFAEIFLGAVAVLVIVIRGFMLITNPGDEEGITKARNHILYALGALALVGLSEIVIRGVIFPKAGEALPDIERGKQIIIMITNFMASFISIIAFLMLFYAGYKFVVSGGEEEQKDKIKKVFISALIALLLALGAFAAVNTLVEFKPPDDTFSNETPSTN